MAIWKRWRSRRKPAGSATQDAERHRPHALREAGVDPIAVRYRREARLWQQLAA